MGLLRRILDTNKRVQEAACSAFATLEEVRFLNLALVILSNAKLSKLFTTQMSLVAVLGILWREYNHATGNCSLSLYTHLYMVGRFALI
jgi:hypothetical protein